MSDERSPDKPLPATPRTDEAAIGFGRLLVEHGTPEKPKFETTELVPADFARQLERELAAMTKLNRLHVEQIEAQRSATATSIDDKRFVDSIISRPMDAWTPAELNQLCHIAMRATEPPSARPTSELTDEMIAAGGAVVLADTSLPDGPATNIMVRKMWTAMSAAAPRAETASLELTVRERNTINNLIALARYVYVALEDGAEELPDGEMQIDEAHSNGVALALAVLDDLPDDRPGVTMCASGKAEWALRRILGDDPSVAVPEEPTR